MLASTLATFAALAAVAHAQSSPAASGTSSAAAPASTAAIPSCALTCVLSSLPNTPCAEFGVGNLTCICTSTEFQSAYFGCQQSTCSEADLNAAEQYGAQSCEANGTPINIDATPSGFSSSSATANQTSTASSGASSASSTSAAASTTAAVSSAASAPSASASGTTGAGASGSSGAAGRTLVGGIVGAAATVAGLAILA
ncbi:hypothetical protein JCM10449v2_007079 [Rhodotorula kratochvilovae]